MEKFPFFGQITTNSSIGRRFVFWIFGTGFNTFLFSRVTRSEKPLDNGKIVDVF